MIKKYFDMLPSEEGKGSGMSKEDLEQKIRKAIKDGDQFDYDRLDNLVPVFKTDEVVENVVIIVESWAKQESIEFAKWIQETNWGEKETWGKYDPPSIPNIDQLYNLFTEQRNIKGL